MKIIKFIKLKVKNIIYNYKYYYLLNQFKYKKYLESYISIKTNKNILLNYYLKVIKYKKRNVYNTFLSDVYLCSKKENNKIIYHYIKEGKGLCAEPICKCEIIDNFYVLYLEPNNEKFKIIYLPFNSEYETRL